MADDDQLNRAHIWPGLVPVWLETATNQRQVAPINIGNQSEKELLTNMLIEVQKLTREDKQLETEWNGQMARKCEATLEYFLARSEYPITDAAPLGLAMLFYEYGRLTMPSLLRDTALNNTARHHVASVKKHKNSSGEGGKKSAVPKKSDSAARKAKAKMMMDELLASGKSERDTSSIIAKRMGVTPKTVRTWRKAGWK